MLVLKMGPIWMTSVSKKILSIQFDRRILYRPILNVAAPRGNYVDTQKIQGARMISTQPNTVIVSTLRLFDDSMQAMLACLAP